MENKTREGEDKNPYIIAQHEVKKAFYFVLAESEEDAYEQHKNRKTRCVGEDYVSVCDDIPLTIELLKSQTPEEEETPETTTSEG
jgi:hypothetical protein